jgi:adenosylcobinamide kinase/adenosylcobinamide-phosphate guanylyltransferase
MMPLSTNSARTLLVLGGARSGKSRYAEALLAAHDGARTYIATAEARDGEMAKRIAAHRARRGPGWRTVEEPLDLVAALEAHCRPTGAVLVDCLTLWLSNLMAASRDIAAETAGLAAALGKLPGQVVLVSNEVGLGIVPDNELARDFRDQAGRLNQAVAEAVDEAVFVAAGLPLRLKP